MTEIMPIAGMDDWERRLARQDAFWRREILDRPVVAMTSWKGGHAAPAGRTYGTIRERWMDAEGVAAHAAASIRNTAFYGDALPSFMPNLGPEVFNAFLGMELEFGENTSWSVANLHDWSGVERIRFDRNNPYWRKMEELTDALLAAGQGLFYVGLTDLHPGGDACAAFRDPMQLNLDLIESPAEVARLMRRVTDLYFEVFAASRKRLADAGQACCTWAGPVSRLTWYVPSNDFSCMVSKEMFDAFFLPTLVEECRALEASLYHLDGPGALRHLDSLLAIPELNAIQWVYGAGHGRASDWLHVYRACQAAGKGVQIFAGLDELETLMGALRPEGVWISLSGVNDGETAAAVLRRVAKWTR